MTDRAAYAMLMNYLIISSIIPFAPRSRRVVHLLLLRFALGRNAQKCNRLFMFTDAFE